MGYASIRDSVESAAAVVGNYLLPGSGMVTSQLVSKGSQRQLGSTLGQLAMMGSGIGGGAEGNLQNWGSGAQSLGMNTSGLSSAVPQGVSDTFGLGENSQFAARTPFGNLGSTGWTPASSLASAGTPAGAGSGINSVIPATPAGPPGGIPNAYPAAPAAASNPLGWGSPMNLMQMGSGAYGIYQGQNMQKLAQQQIDAAAAQRNNIAMPTAQNITSMPGYESGLEAVQRSMMAQGYQGSGNMMAALQQYGGSFYQQAMQNYLAGQGVANQTAGLGANIAGSASNMTGNGLASMGQAALFASPIGNQALLAAMGRNTSPTVQ